MDFVVISNWNAADVRGCVCVSRALLICV